MLRRQKDAWKRKMGELGRSASGQDLVQEAIAKAQREALIQQEAFEATVSKAMAESQREMFILQETVEEAMARERCCVAQPERILATHTACHMQKRAVFTARTLIVLA